jgi:hypothetical protein
MDDTVPGACPIDRPCEQDEEIAVFGAVDLLAEYLQTEEFRKGFLAFAKAKGAG